MKSASVDSPRLLQVVEAPIHVLPFMRVLRSDVHILRLYAVFLHFLFSEERELSSDRRHYFNAE